VLSGGNGEHGRLLRTLQEVAFSDFYKGKSEAKEVSEKLLPTVAPARRQRPPGVVFGIWSAARYGTWT
jgi:hypothetical protein